MKKTAIFLLSLLLIAAAGCSSQKDKPSGSPDTSPAGSEKNPFQSEDEGSAGVLGSIGHSPVNPNRDDNGKILPFVYKGGEMNIAYAVNASGKAKNVGFLVFVDGISQPYKTDSDATYTTMHVVNLVKDHEDYPFSILFDPVTGKKGETLSLTIVSVYAPDFMPDMVKTSGYGLYHDTLANNYEIRFEKDAKLPDSSSLPKYRQIRNVKQSTEPITQSYIDRLSVFSGMQTITLETLNKQVFAQQFFNGQGGLISNLQVNADGTLHITFKITGYPRARYRNTMYINHQALTDGENTSFETTLTKGNVSIIEGDLELSGLEGLNTFYVISTLCNVQELWEDGTPLIKTPSVLLYK